MMDLARLADLDHQAGLDAQALADQVVVHRRRRQQRRDRRRGRPTRRGPTGSGCCGRPARSRSPRSTDAVERLLQARPRLRRRARWCRCVAVRKAPSSSSSIERIFSSSALVRIGCDDLEPLVRAGMVAEQVRARADHRHQRHHQLLADRVDRRVGDLREVLLEVVVEQLAACCESTAIGVSVPIEPTGSSPARCHRLEEELDVLLGVAEGLLAIEQGRRIVRRRRRRRVGQLRQLLELVLRLAQPLLVGLGLGERRASAPRPRRCGPARGRSAASCRAAGATCARSSPRGSAARPLPRP